MPIMNLTMVSRILVVLISAMAMLVAADNFVPAHPPSPSPSPQPAAHPMFQPPVSLDSLAQNLPEAFAALEGQFKDAGFKSMLTSQLSNPNAVEMFESMIHDPSAVSSISLMLNDPAVKSSLWEQFATPHPGAINSGIRSASIDSSASVSAEATGDYEFSESKSRIEHGRSSMNLETLDRSHSGVSGRPGLIVTGWVIVILLSALAPTY